VDSDLSEERQQPGKITRRSILNLSQYELIITFPGGGRGSVKALGGGFLQFLLPFWDEAWKISGGGTCGLWSNFAFVAKCNKPNAY